MNNLVSTSITSPDYSKAHNCPDIIHRTVLCVYIVIVSVLNLLLLYLIFFKTIKAMADYKMVLFTTTIIDFTSAWSQFLIGIRPTLENDMQTFNFDGFLPYWVADWPMFAGGNLHWLALFETFSSDFSFAFGIMPFLYRYFAVCWDWKLRFWQFFILTCCTAWLAAWSSGSYAWMGSVFYEQNAPGVFYNPNCVRPMTSWTSAQSESNLNPALYYWMFRGWSYGYWGILYSYASLFYCGWRIYVRVSSDAFVFESKKARAAARQLTLTITLQAVCPLIVTGGSLIFLYIGLKTEFHKADSFVVLFYSFLVFPILNPLISLTFISSYRRFLVSSFTRVFGLHRCNPTRVVPTGIIIHTTSFSVTSRHKNES
ncbi:hypothetical protein M3Y95_01209000 [Aphelenchoides besseyi]|nr:hypothetical protein M3Y95_01209000 [Aphelenchoides besseyi]